VKGDKDLADILKQNEEWIDEMKKEDPKFFDKLGAVHKPTYFWIGKFPGALGLCSDELHFDRILTVRPLLLVLSRMC
jgi:hypothetical protein